MGRRSGSSGGGYAPARSAPTRKPPAPASPASPPDSVSAIGAIGNILGSIGSTIAEGMAFGAGNAVAHRAVDAAMGPRTIELRTNAPDVCSIHAKVFKDCLNSNKSDISKCQFYLDQLSECHRNPAGSVLNK